MSKLEALIQQYCPEGVEYRRIDDITISLSTGLNPRQNFKLNETGADCYYVTVKEMASGKIIFSAKTDKIPQQAVSIIQNRSHLEEEDILLSGIGTIGKVAIVDIPTDNWNCSESVILIKANKDVIEPKFLKYILEGEDVQNYFNQHATGSTLKGIRQNDLKALSIPVPPLPVQEEIVRILDNFSLLSAELEAELEGRRKQYDFYRNQLLSFDSGSVPVQWKKLGDIANLFKGTYITKNSTIPGNIPVVLGGQEPAYFINTFNHEGEIIAVSRSGASAGFVSYWNEPIFITDGFGFEAKENIISSRFLFYIMKHRQYELQQMKRGAGVPHISYSLLKDVVFPVPPLSEQQRIVDILDRFDMLTNDLTSGLPAEIAARKQQYEYYRDKLLTFKRKDA